LFQLKQPHHRDQRSLGLPRLKKITNYGWRSRRRRTHLIQLQCPEGSDSLREARAIVLRLQAMLLVVETDRGSPDHLTPNPA
jgi:hypothetical protein